MDGGRPGHLGRIDIGGGYPGFLGPEELAAIGLEQDPVITQAEAANAAARALLIEAAAAEQDPAKTADVPAEDRAATMQAFGAAATGQSRSRGYFGDETGDQAAWAVDTATDAGSDLSRTIGAQRDEPEQESK